MQQTTTKSSGVNGPSIEALRAQIPAHCFTRSTFASAVYILQDVTLVAALALATSEIPSLESAALRMALWTAYGLFQGFVFTGVWICAHECGHRALFDNDWLNNGFGFVLHSFLLVPYFSWKYSHAKHHRYTNHMDKDTAFIPAREDSFSPLAWMEQALHLGEDSPILALAFLIGHQLIGWPMYLIFNITAGEKSLEADQDSSTGVHNHFNPVSGIFSKSQRRYILYSDLGILAQLTALWWASTKLGWGQVGLLYGVPYLWVNHWLVAITYLHHSHPEKLHFEADAWTFQKGALSTVDRDFGLVGKYLFHGIIEFHVIHHLFPRIPFYHAEEATIAIVPVLGKNYLRDDTPFMEALWTTFSNLKYVRPLESDPSLLTWVQKPSKSVRHGTAVLS